MIENLNFLVAPLLLALFGLPAGFVPKTRGEPAGVRFSLMFMTGTVAFVVWETALSLSGVAWTPFTVVLPLGLASVATAWFVSRRGSAADTARFGGWDVLGIAIGIGGAAHLVLAAATARSTSIDFFYFWGVKAIRFAAADGIDASFLGSIYSGHTHTPYPPLLPLVTAWGVDGVGYLPWRAGLVSMTMWIVLAYPIVLKGLRSVLPRGEATLAGGVWLLAICLAVTSSYSAGNAEPPLLFFATVAIVAVIAKEGAFPRWVAPVALCGVVLTKTEGLILVILLIVGLGLRDLPGSLSIRESLRRLSGILVPPVLALGIWIAFELKHGLPISDAARESAGVMSMENLGPALIAMLRYLDAGSGWLAWTLAVSVLALSWRSWRSVLPALTVAGGILAFLLVYYLHYQGGSIDTWVRWTLPRVSLTALSAVLLAAAVASGIGANDDVDAARAIDSSRENS